ncbi:biotin--[acetyl-CoA-carboxylase] ligase [Francisellaceae bacterium CB299]|jgi:BirA family transcriptional regulator, biotin operon repressor / biotin---[acetyl-CoA-carboxylase] ligase
MKDHSYINLKLKENLGDICVEHYKTIGSTNDYLLEKDFIHKYHLCYADAQTKGRGRRQSNWVSKVDSNIYSTTGFKCSFSIEQAPLVSIKAAVGVLEGIKKFIPAGLQKYLKIKLPNDIYFNGQKLAGILIETKNIKANSFDIVIGVGVNVNALSLGEDIDRDWTSLAIINKSQVNFSDVLVNMITSLIKTFEYTQNEVLAKFAEYDYILGKTISFNYGDKSYQGVAKGISNDLKLMIESDELLEVDIASINTVRVVERNVY